MNTTTKEKIEYVLTTSDRCDRCGVQAWVLIKGVSGQLLFCSHHYNKNAEKLVEWAYDIVDERERLIEDKLTGSEN